MELNKIYNEDCIEGMKKIEDKSVDMILCDLPYGITACKWDTIIPLEPLWEQYERAIKDNGAIVLTASQPFTSKLVMSNPKIFRYDITWDKVAVSNPFLANKRPLRSHEDILIFYKKQPTYNKQMRVGTKRKRGVSKSKWTTGTLGNSSLPNSGDDTSNLKNPNTVLTISNANKINRLHPTQKPVTLFEYLIKTYTNEGETVLDNCMGSGTTAIAAINTNRNYLGFELDEKYFELANDRIEKHNKQMELFEKQE